MILKTVRSKFYFLYFCMALSLTALAFYSLYYSINTFYEKKYLLDEYEIFKLSTSIIHMLQKERGLTLKKISFPTNDNEKNLITACIETQNFISSLPHSYYFENISKKIKELRKFLDSPKIYQSEIFLKYSDIISEIMTHFTSNKTFSHARYDNNFIMLINLLNAREYLGKIRAHISMISEKSYIDESSIFYIREKFNFYNISKNEFLLVLHEKWPDYYSDVINDEKIKNTEEIIRVIIENKHLKLNCDNWFELSTYAMDSLYNIETKLSIAYENYLEMEMHNTKFTGIAIIISTVFIICFSAYFLITFITSFTSRIEKINSKMKLVLETNNYKIEILDSKEDEISQITNSINSLLKFSNELLEEKEIMATTDSLTGILNRSKFLELFNLELNNFMRYKTVFSILIIDIDHFKKVNDNFGHNTGDLVLVEFTKIISKYIRTTDVFARWGGEEFIILATSTNLDSAVELAEKLRVLISEHTFSENLHITASFGVSEIRVGDSLEKIVARADAALYQSKQTGRNKVSIYKNE